MKSVFDDRGLLRLGSSRLASQLETGQVPAATVKDGGPKTTHKHKDPAFRFQGLKGIPEVCTVGSLRLCVVCKAPKDGVRSSDCTSGLRRQHSCAMQGPVNIVS